MSDSKKMPGENVVVMPSKKAILESEKKWGVVTMRCHFTILPALLLRAGARIGISPTQLALIIQINDFWWNHEKWPWVTYAELGHRLNISEKVVQRNMAALEKRGYVKRITRILGHRRRANGYDLSGLIAQLQKLAPEFLDAEDAKKKVQKRGGVDVLARKM